MDMEGRNLAKLQVKGHLAKLQVKGHLAKLQVSRKEVKGRS